MQKKFHLVNSTAVWVMSALAVIQTIMSFGRQPVVWVYPPCKSSQKHLQLHQLSSGLQWPCPGWLVVMWSIRAVKIFKIFNGLQGISVSEKAGK